MPTTARRFAVSARTALALALMLVAAPPAMAQARPAPASPLPAIVAQVDAGQFSAANIAIDRALKQKDLSPSQRDAIAYQRERMRRIRIDFSLDAEAAKARLRKQIPDLTDAEFARWDGQGLIERMTIDGQTRYFSRAPGNLFLISREAAARRAHPAPPTTGPNEVLNDHHRAVRREALASGSTHGAPVRIELTHSITVNADAVPAGATLKTWIPYPQALPGQQEDIQMVTSEPAGAQVAPAGTPQRTAFLERKAVAGQPTTFSITYDITIYGQYHAIDPAKVTAEVITPALKPYVAQRPPHIVFTSDLRAYSRKVVGSQTNPYRIAQKLFAAVDTIPWAGAREYSTISNLSDYTLHAGHGDCGEQTMLLMTLLRLNGIPTRWQSGFMFSSGSYNNIHDWGQLYLPPYGWVPMDVTFGQLQPGTGDDPSLRWFYLGGLDAYRIAFNSDYGQPFVPAKQYPRSDTVDSQRGEVEWQGGNLYYDQWDYHFAWKFLPLEKADTATSTSARSP